MSEPGYYKVNYRAFRLRDLIHSFGVLRGVPLWIASRFMPNRTGSWMPLLWADGECKPEALNEDLWEATKPHRAEFEKLGFTQYRLARSPKSLNRLILDSGTVFYLDPTRSCLGGLMFGQIYYPIRKKSTNNIFVTFTASFENGTMSCTNRPMTFDSGKLIRLNSKSVPEIYKKFQEELQRSSETPRSFSDNESLRQWFDARAISNFEDHVRQGLFIRMTDSEIAAARVNLERKPPRAVPPAVSWILISIIIVCGSLALILKTVINTRQHRLWQMNAGTENTIPMKTVDYQGQIFKLSRPYTDFDVYKNDPNNLDTNELPRIERTMESVKIPATFKDFKEYIYVTASLEFPGYGQTVGGAQTDDGSTLMWASTEIPQANKERVVAGRGEINSSWKLADDFIYESDETNSIGRVQLKDHQLEYFDRNGRLVRKKPI